MPDLLTQNWVAPSPVDAAEYVQMSLELQVYNWVAVPGPADAAPPLPTAGLMFVAPSPGPSQVDFGADVSTYPDLDASMVLNGDPRLLSQALLRRFQTPRGSLSFHPDYGLDLREFVNETVTDELHYRLKSELEREAEQDERILSAVASVRFDPMTETIYPKLELETADGPFQLRLEVTKVAVTLLNREES